jgi:deoxycitidine kinase/deoxyguanosine kinase
VSIDGNIGSGKSTFISHLKNNVFTKSPNVIFLPEPVDEWNTIVDIQGNSILSKFYQDQDKYSFSFQMMAYISRLVLMQDKIKEIKNLHARADDNSDKNTNDNHNNNECYYIFTERSLNTDREIFAKMLYEQGKMEDVNYQIYLKWFNNFAYLPDTYIHINTDPEICLERIKKRSREGESLIELDYLKLCHRYHCDMFDKLTSLNINAPKNVLIMNGNETDNHHSLTNQLRSFMQI